MTPLDRRWKLIRRGTCLGLCLGGVSGSLLAGLSELLYGVVPAFPYFLFGGVLGAVAGTICGFLAAMLSLTAERAVRRWPKSIRALVVGLAAFAGTMLPFLGFLGPDLFDVGGTWVLWTGGLAAVPLASWFLHRVPPINSSS